MLSPSPPSSVDCVELKLEYTTSTLHRGRRGGGGGEGGEMPQFEELLRWCPKSFGQGCRGSKQGRNQRFSSVCNGGLTTVNSLYYGHPNGTCVGILF